MFGASAFVVTTRAVRLSCGRAFLWLSASAASLRAPACPAILSVLARVPAGQSFSHWAFDSAAEGRLSGRQTGSLEGAVVVGFGLGCSGHGQLETVNYQEASYSLLSQEKAGSGPNLPVSFAPAK